MVSYVHHPTFWHNIFEGTWIKRKTWISKEKITIFSYEGSLKIEYNNLRKIKSEVRQTDQDDMFQAENI